MRGVLALCRAHSGLFSFCIALAAVLAAPLAAFADPPTLADLVTAAGVSSNVTLGITTAAGIVAIIVVGVIAFALIARLSRKAGRAFG
jgi:hypothetical protein